MKARATTLAPLCSGSSCRRESVGAAAVAPILAGGWLFLAAVVPCLGQAPAALKGIDVAPSGDILLHAEPLVPNPDELLLQSSDFPNGPWWTVPGQGRSTAAGGYDFLAPRKGYQSRQFYRLGTFGSGSTRPYIRFIAPHDRILLGQQVTLHGDNFSATPANNTVTFTLLTGFSSQAAVVSATPRQLVFTVPGDLEVPFGDPPILYRVTVTTAAGTSNGVGCQVRDTQFAPAFELKPDSAVLTLPPGSGTETLVIGGGVPPYTLDPLTPESASLISAVMDGNLITLTAAANSPGGIAGVTVRDSEGREDTSTVAVSPAQFEPSFFATFHTTLAGSAPGFALHLSVPSGTLPVGHAEFSLQGTTLEIGRLRAGDIAAFVEFSSPSRVDVGLAHLQITAVESRMAHFDVIAMEDDGPKVIGSGGLIAQPATIFIRSETSPAGAVVPRSDQRILFKHHLVRLPAGVGAPFAISGAFTSGSFRRDRHETLEVAGIQNFITGGTAGPRIEIVQPVEAQASALVKLTGTGMGLDSVVTFTGSSGTVPAVIKEIAADGITVIVPDGADAAGPIQVTSGGQPSNPHQFWPRFHGDAVLVFDSFQANTAAAFRLLFQQLADTSGTEIPIGKIKWTIDGGAFDFSNLVEFEDTGTIAIAAQNDTFEDSFSFWYAGEEAGSGRHVFESPYNRMVLSNAAGGQGVMIELEQTQPDLRIDLAWDVHFTAGVYVPPAAGTIVRTRMEMLSRSWRSASVPPLNINRNFKQVVEP